MAWAYRLNSDPPVPQVPILAHLTTFHNPPFLCYTPHMADSKAVVPAEPDYLTLNQNQTRFLTVFNTCRTIAEACEEAGIHYNTWYRWKTRDSAFQEALARIQSMGIEQARVNMDNLAIKASERLEEALDAKELTTCPHCKQDLVCENCNVPVAIRDQRTVTKAVELVMKRQGDLVNKTEVSGTIAHVRELTHDQRIAARMYREGNEIPPEMKAELESMGALPDRVSAVEEAEVEVEVEDPDIVEGEVVKTPPSKKTPKRRRR